MTRHHPRASRLSHAASAWVIATALAVTSASCAKDPEVAKREFEQSGDAYAHERKYPEAIIQYRNAVQQDPRYGHVRLKLAEAYLQIGDRVNAVAEIVRAADLLPREADTQVKAGNLLLVSRQFEDARARADKALALDPSNVDAQILRANALAGLNQIAEAVAEMESAIRNDPERSSAYAGLGAMQMVRGNKVEAEAAFKRAVDASPRSAQAHLALANFYLALQRPVEAEKELHSALAIAPTHLLANRAMAYFYIGSGKPALAEPHLRTIADLAPDSSGKLTLAAFYASRRRLDDARHILEQVIAQGQAGAVAARLQLASLSFSSGDSTRASRLIDEVLAKEPSNTRALTSRAELLADSGRLDEAMVAARKASESDPLSAAAHFAEGKVAVLQRDEVTALAAFNEAMRLDPRLLQAKLELARLHLASGRLEQAEQLAQSVVADAPSAPDARILLARIQVARGSIAAADASVRGLAKDSPDLPGVQVTIALIELRRNNRLAARAALVRALEKQPANLEALGLLVRLDLNEKQTDAAKTRVEAALRSHPDDPAVLLLASRTMEALGNNAAAEGYARRVTEVDVNNLDSYVALGRIYARTQRLDQATEQFRRLAERQPQSVPVQTVVGVLLQMQNRIPEAQARYERILQFDGRAAVAANNLAWIYVAHGGNLDKALSLAQTAKTELPNRPEVNDTLGWVYYKRGLYSMAITPLAQAVAGDPDNASYHYHLGATQAALGNDVEARAALGAAVRLDGPSVEANEARALLATLSK